MFFRFVLTARERGPPPSEKCGEGGWVWVGPGMGGDVPARPTGARGADRLPW